MFLGGIRYLLSVIKAVHGQCISSHKKANEVICMLLHHELVDEDIKRVVK